MKTTNKLLMAGLILCFSGQLLADLVSPNPRNRDIRKSSVKQIDLIIYVVQTAYSTPTSKAFSLELNCYQSPLWDLFGWMNKLVYSKTFECPTQQGRFPDTCNKMLKISALPTELAGNVSCDARVSMEDVEYEFSTHDYARESQRWNFPLEYPYIGRLDAIYLPLDQATATYSSPAPGENPPLTDNQGQ
ncbi:hypothetical protein [Endozoicomonas arenosclerae]|uniref:hypothetical protein n=1 Tax=Endozoicomonas arenosclerae TaxID=1633495 RepID=UPI000782B83D|nr:hypothetical protein [Endozoicomonas arenosclerae]